MAFSKIAAENLGGSTLPALAGGSLTGISGGKVLKVQSYEFTGDTYTTSASIQNFLTCSYTPTASNSNLFATLSYNYQLYGNNASQTSGGQVVIETPGSVIRATQGFSINSMSANDHYIEFSGNISAFWNQNTTSAFNITLGCATRGVGRIRIFGNSVGSPFNPSATRFTVMEIAA